MARRTRTRRGGVFNLNTLTKNLGMGKRTAPAAPARETAPTTSSSARTTNAVGIRGSESDADESASANPSMFQRMAERAKRFTDSATLTAGEAFRKRQALSQAQAQRQSVGGLKGRKSRRKGRKSRRRGTKKGMRRKTARKAYKH